MPFQASSLAMVQSTETWRTSPACTHGRGRLRACAARIFCVRVIGWDIGGGYMHRESPPRKPQGVGGSRGERAPPWWRRAAPDIQTRSGQDDRFGLFSSIMSDTWFE